MKNFSVKLAGTRDVLRLRVPDVGRRVQERHLLR